jgi:hypothetical protein
MKKKIVTVLIIVLALLVLFVVFNQFDASPRPDLFTSKDIPPASLDRTNGFYYVFALGEAPGTDITSDAIIEKYRNIQDTSIDYQAYIKKFDFEKYRAMYRNNYLGKYNKCGIKSGEKQDIFRKDISQNDWCEEILSIRSQLSPLDPDLQVLYNRFRMMIDSPLFEDFIAVDADAPLPNLLAWLHASKLYTAVNMLRALEGDWETGVANLLDEVDFAKRAVKSSRFLIENLISKAIMHLPLQAIASLMNRRDCPAAVYEMVLKRTPPLKFEEYGTRNSFICEVVAFTFHYIDNTYFNRTPTLFERLAMGLLLQENRTKNYADEYYKQFIQMEKTPPYQWKSDEIELAPLKSGFFWWFQNAGGKVLFSHYNDYYTREDRKGGLYTVMYKSYMKKAFYDMVRISAELHLKYEPGRPVQEILNGLDSYKVLDPCSGKPYKWNDERQILYSIGMDRVDNNGETLSYTQIENTDYTTPVILFLK